LSQDNVRQFAFYAACFADQITNHHFTGQE